MVFNVVVYLNEEVFLEVNLGGVQNRVGKDPSCLIVLPGWNISKDHACLIVSDDELFIQDSGGIFGTYVNDSRIIRHGPISNLDVIRIGSYTMSVYGAKSTSASDRPAVKDDLYEVGPASPTRDNTPIQAMTLSPNVLSSSKPDGEVRTAVLVEKVANSCFDTIPTARVRTPEQINFDKWRKLVHEAVLHEMDARRIDAIRLKDEELRSNVRLIIKEVIGATRDLPAQIDVSELSKQVLDEAIGLGPLEPLLTDDSVSEIMLNKYDEIWIERSGRLSLSTSTFSSDSAVLGAIERIVTPLGRRIDESSPMVDARLKDGSRVNAIIAPLSLRGPSLTIRKFSKKKITADDYVAFGSLTPEMVKLLTVIVSLRLNIIVSGGTGTGKTSFLNMIASYIEKSERVLTIEDAAELKLPQPNLVSLESRPPNLEGKGGISIRDLLRNSLRMRPDRIIVGECRGGEALDMLQAMNTGHDGSMTTLHSNSPRDALARLEVLVLMAGVNLPVRAIREQIASAVNVIIQLTRFSCGARKITSITEVLGMEGEVMQTNEIYRFKKTGINSTGVTLGVFEYGGIKPEFMSKLD